MDMMVAATHGTQLRNEGVQPLAAAAKGPAPLQKQASAETPALAVTAMTAGDTGASGVADDADKEKGGDSSAEDKEGKSSSSDEQGYKHRLVYDDEINRTFIDVVSREDDKEVLMRLPPEKLTRFLQESSSNSGSGSSSVSGSDNDTTAESSGVDVVI